MQRRDIKELGRMKDIVIKPADKGVMSSYGLLTFINAGP